MGPTKIACQPKEISKQQKYINLQSSFLLFNQSNKFS